MTGRIHYTDADGINAIPVTEAEPLPVTAGTGASATEVQGTAADGAAVAGKPVRVAGKDGSGNTQDIATDTSGNVVVVGNIASGATDSGAPVKMGGIYNSALPTLTNAQRGDLQLRANGSVLVTIGGSSVGSDALSNSGYTGIYGLNGAASGLLVGTNVFNGTTWDRERKPNGTSRIPSSANTTNATVAKAAAGDLHTVSGYNTNAAVRYLKVYSKATAPTVGTDTPILTIPLPPTAVFNYNLGGHYIATGISYALTTGAADADTGAVGSGDILGLNLSYA